LLEAGLVLPADLAEPAERGASAYLKRTRLRHFRPQRPQRPLGSSPLSAMTSRVAPLIRHEGTDKGWRVCDEDAALLREIEPDI
jgi:hypothetical protein